MTVATLLIICPAQAKPEPLVEYREINISGGLGCMRSDVYGPYNPWSIKIKMTSVFMGFTYVEVVSGGSLVWDGSLGTGQSSPWITTNGLTTYVNIWNVDFEYIAYWGKICMYES